MKRRLRALGAAVFLLFLVVGVPFILVRLVGWPLPDRVPDPGSVLTRLRQGDIPAEAVINTLAVIVWLGWFQLAWSVLWETLVNVPRLSSGRVWRPPPLVLSPVGDGCRSAVLGDSRGRCARVFDAGSGDGIVGSERGG